MTTKNFTLIENDNNGNLLGMKDYATRAEAIDAMLRRLENDETTTPQNFKIEVSEVVDIKNILKSTAYKIDEGLTLFLKNYAIVDLVFGGDGFVEMKEKTKFPSLTSVEMAKIIKIIDEVNAELPEGYEVFYCISHECAIRLFLSTPKDKVKK